MSASFATNALTASYAANVPLTASFAISASRATDANNAISASQAANAVSASFATSALTASYAANVPLTASFAISASQATDSNNATSASQATNANNATSASQAANAISSSFASTATSASQAQNAVSSSFATNATNADLLDGKNSTEFAITGSNIFTGIQYNTDTTNPNGFGASASIYTDGGLRVTQDTYVSGTIYVNNLTVFGTQSINYITSSQLNIGTNIISVNTDTPSIRFGGLAVYDSGSTGLTGSMLWDSERDHWVYSNPSGSSYSGGMLMSGPRASSLGNEQGTLNNVIVKGQGGDHVTSSQIIDDGTTVRIPGNLQVTGSTIITGALTGTSATFNGNIEINVNQNSLTRLLVRNTTAGTGAYVETTYTSDASAGSGAVGKFSSTSTTYKITTASNTYLYNSIAGDIAILNDFSSGAIKMAAGGSSTSHFTIASTGAATFSSGVTVNGQLAVSAPATTVPIVCSVANQEQYILISSSTGREAMSQYYNPTAGNWYTGVRANAGLTDTASYHIYSSTYGNDVLAITTGGTTVVRALGIGINPTQTAALVFADGVGAKILLNNNANNYRIDLVTAVAGGDAMFKFIAGSTGAGEFGFYTGTTLVQLITASGRQVINATASVITGYSGPVQSLMINGGSGDGALTLNSSSTGYAYINFSQALTSKFEIGIVGTGGNGSFYINRNIQQGENGASVYINKSNGFVGILRNNPSFALDVNGDIRSGRLRNNGDLVLDSYATVNPSSNVFLYSTPNDRDMWVMLDSADTTSNWGIYYRQIDSALGSLPANSVAYIGGGNNGLRAWICLANGDYFFGGANLSDVRSKHNINYISYSAIDKVKALKPATFYYNENPNISKGGFIAQDVKEVLPEFVTNKDDKKYMMGVDYYGIIAVLTKGMQEQQAQIEELKTEIDLLKAQ